MPKVGRFVTDARAGTYCQITLDSGERVIVNHEKGGFKGGPLTIEVTKFMGLSSDRIFACNLDSPAGQSVLACADSGHGARYLAATPLGAAVEFVKAAGPRRTEDEVRGVDVGPIGEQSDHGIP